MEKLLNIFSVDLEDWYHSSPAGQPFKTNDYRVIAPTEKLLDHLGKTKNYGTFFVVGEVAKRHPQLIKKIASLGHEIGCHGFHHQFINLMSPQQFESDLKKTVTLLEDITQKKVLGYRAPAWSVCRSETPWFWDILAKYHLKYSSSVFPYKTYLYGDNQAPRFSTSIGSITETPPSTLEIHHQRFPFSGGFYFRLLPLPIIKLLTQTVNRQNHPVIFYIHPWELDPTHPRIPLKPMETFIHELNLKKTFPKLKKLLVGRSFTSFERFYHFS
ncbi:polysaccharide deacetylase family protein [Patescibacteria group bacterium]|nr:polysaccharide deacetylase family protein [Patescibacteria group bacterium]